MPEKNESKKEKKSKSAPAAMEKASKKNITEKTGKEVEQEPKPEPVVEPVKEPVKVKAGEPVKEPVKEQAEEPADETGAEKMTAGEAQQTVKTHMWWAMGAGLLPFPGVDLAALAVVQLKMLQRLAGHYGVEFSEHRGKSIIAALVGTVLTSSLSRSFLSTFLKSIPFVGVIGAFSMSLFAGASTYAVGKVFIQHFECGGTLLDFDPQKVKDHFKELYKEGEEEASKVKSR